MSYARCAAMIAVSTIVMYGLMYLNTWALDQVFFNQTRAWMALQTGAVMAVIMARKISQFANPRNRSSRRSRCFFHPELLASAFFAR